MESPSASPPNTNGPQASSLTRPPRGRYPRVQVLFAVISLFLHLLKLSWPTLDPSLAAREVRSEPVRGCWGLSTFLSSQALPLQAWQGFPQPRPNLPSWCHQATPSTVCGRKAVAGGESEASSRPSLLGPPNLGQGRGLMGPALSFAALNCSGARAHCGDCPRKARMELCVFWQHLHFYALAPPPPPVPPTPSLALPPLVQLGPGSTREVPCGWAPPPGSPCPPHQHSARLLTIQDAL